MARPPVKYRYRNEGGYVRIISPSRFCGCYEHRVIEAMKHDRKVFTKADVDRILIGLEVHHKNGVRNDNRPNNLKAVIAFKERPHRA